MGRLLTPLDALRLGWSIIPCGLNKKPLVKWKKYQTEWPTEEQVLEWEKLNPASWAIINGKLSNRVTLEYTKDEGERTAELLGLPAPHRRSPRGGGHVDCNWPGFNVPTLNDKTCKELRERCPGLDVKGDGGYCIFLGKSIYGEYEWLLDTTNAYDLDLAIWTKVLPPKPEKKAKAKPTNGADKFNGSTKRVDVELLVRMALVKVTAGMGRNNAGAWLAIQLRDNRYSKDEALDLEFSEHCPPTDACGNENEYTAEEWSNTVESIFSQPARKPWRAPAQTPLMLPAPVLLAPLDSADIPFMNPAQAAELQAATEESQVVAEPRAAAEAQAAPAALLPAEVLPFPDSAKAAAPQAAPVTVSLADLLTRICTFIRRFMFMTAAQIVIVAWIIHTHTIEGTDYTPYLDIHSPMMRSGKTLLLEICKLLVRNPWMTGYVSRSSLMRKVDKFRPTLLLDESDATFNGNSADTDALRAFLDLGYERDGVVSISVPVGNGWESRDFPAFGPKAIAGIGDGLPNTVKDRSIPIVLKRKLKTDKVERFRKRKVKPEGAALYKLIDQWARVNIIDLSQVEPELPEELDDRKWDTCEHLLAIADAAGGNWPEVARKALVKACGQATDSEDLSLRLLLDTRSVFKQESFSTGDLLSRLTALIESPWRESNRNNPLSARQLANLLRPFEISSKPLHEGTGEARRMYRGYLKADFEDAWARYLGPETASEEPAPGAAPPSSASHPHHPHQANKHAGPSEFSHPHQEASGADSKNEESPMFTRVGADGADRNPDTESEADSSNVEQWPSSGKWARFGDQDKDTNRVRHLHLDLETRSRLNLKTVGVDVYSANCEILMLAWAYDDGEVEVATSDARIPEHLLADLTDADVMKLAWNSQFERAVIREQLGIDSPVEQWTDPMVLARYVGLPGKLALASEFLNPKGEAKDREGARLIQKFSKLHRSKRLGDHFKDWNDPKHGEDWQRFQHYNRQDVVAERAVYRRLKTVFTPPVFERQLWELDQRINERGMPVSVEYVRNAEEIVLRARKQLEASLAALTGLRNVNSVSQLLGWLRQREYPYSDLSREHVAQALEGSQGTLEAIEALKIRQTIAKASVRKLHSIEDRMKNGRIRYGYRFYGAHSGRWSGEGVQMQNLPRTPSTWGEAEVNLRTCFQAPEGYKFVVADLTSIETRVLAWLTKCEPLLSVFERGEDPYIDFASTWFSTPYVDITCEERQLAKPAVLGAGYMLSGGEIRMSCCGNLSAAAIEDESKPVCICEERGDEFKSGLWGYAERMSVPLARDQAHDAVRAYRAKYWAVTDFWHGVEAVAIEVAVTGNACEYFGIRFGAIPQELLWVKLPSGRRLHYLRPQVGVGRGTELTHESYGLRGWQRQKIYGGLLTENLVQSISRDILAQGLLQADADGLTIVGHCHDEIICLEPNDSINALNRLIAAMTAPVSWAPGLKLKAEGYEGTVYKKG